MNKGHVTTERPVDKLAGLIGRIRRAKKLTQEELAEMTGTSQMTIQRIENAAGGTRMETVIAIADGLGISLTDLFKEIEDREPRRVIGLNERWDDVIHRVDKLPEDKKEYLAVAIEQILEGFTKAQQ